MPSVQLKEQITRHFGTTDFILKPIECPGLSGLPIYRVQYMGQLFALRAWPNTPASRSKIEDWYLVVTHLATSSRNARLFPKIEKWRGELLQPLFQTINDFHWTLASWLEGRPLSAESISESVRLQLVERLAILHRETDSVQTCTKSSLAIQERLHGLKAIASAPSNWKRSHPLEVRLRSTMRDIQNESPFWEKFLRIESLRDRKQHWIVRDLWRENLLVDEHFHLLSIVDLGASRVEWPVFDFVRLMGSLNATMKSWANAYEVYQSFMPSSTLPELAVCVMLHRISTAISIAYWNDKLNDETLQYLHPDRMLARMSELLDIWDNSET